MERTRIIWAVALSEPSTLNGIIHQVLGDRIDAFVLGDDARDILWINSSIQAVGAENQMISRPERKRCCIYGDRTFQGPRSE